MMVHFQANLWTEYVADEETVEYMLLPRFLARLRAQLPHLDARGLNYRPLG